MKFLNVDEYMYIYCLYICKQHTIRCCLIYANLFAGSEIGITHFRVLYCCATTDISNYATSGTKIVCRICISNNKT